MAVTTYLYSINDLDLITAERHLGLYLNGEEVQRVLRIRHEQNRHTSMLGRILLRRLLAVELGCKALDVGIATTKNGKPVLETHHNAGVCCDGAKPEEVSDTATYFNVSHSGSYIAIALSDTSDVGIDVEAVKPRESEDDLAEYVMHPQELSIYRGLSKIAAKEFFYRTWVLKEAYTKYVGQGIQMGLKSVQTQVEPPEIIVSPDLVAQFLPVPEGYASSVVFKPEAEQKEEVHQNILASVFDV